MSPIRPRSRSRQHARLSAAHRTSGRGRVSVPWLEALESRTLLSFNGRLQSLEQSVLDALGTSIPIVGSQFANFAPVKDLFNQFASPLDRAVANPTGASSLAAAVTGALGSLLHGAVQVTGSGPYVVSAGIQENKTIDFANDPTQVGIGLGNFLNVNVTENLNVTLDFNYLLNFTVQTNGSASLISTTKAPMTIDLVGTLSGFSATGRLNNLLTASVSVPDGAKSPSFDVALAINPGDNGSVDIQSPKSTAEATLGLALSFGFEAKINPKIDATLHIAWSDEGHDLTGNFNDLSIDQIGLDVGGLLPDFLTNVIGDIQHYTKPLQPIANFLQADVPGLDKLGVHLSIEKLAELDGYPGLGTFVNVVDLLNSLPSTGASDTGEMLPLGGELQFSGPAIKSIQAGGSDTNVIGTVSERRILRATCSARPTR